MFPVIKARYKVTRVVMAREEYAAVYAVRITERSKTEYLLNVYAGDSRYKYHEVFFGLGNCDAFVEIFIWEGALVSVFRVESGTPIDDVFYKGASLTWKERIEYAGLLVDAALSVALLPYEISCAAIMSFNIVVMSTEKRIAVNYAVPPLDGASEGEFIALLGDQLHKILIPRLESAAGELRFLERVACGDFRSVAKLYAGWRSARGDIEREYEDFYSKKAMGRALAVAGRCVKRLFKRKGGKTV
jgi:hypothetical protein